MNIANIAILIGTLLTLGGIGMLFFAVRQVLASRRAGDPELLSQALRKAAILNMVALFLSAIGLSVVIVAILLG